MLLEDLINQFVLMKKEKPSNVNDLLDFIQRGYVQGELSIMEYRRLFLELHTRGAEKPKYLSEEIDLLNQEAII
jgi:hypothetical protein